MPSEAKTLLESNAPFKSKTPREAKAPWEAKIPFESKTLKAHALDEHIRSTVIVNDR